MVAFKSLGTGARIAPRFKLGAKTAVFAWRCITLIDVILSLWPLKTREAFTTNLTFRFGALSSTRAALGRATLVGLTETTRLGNVALGTPETIVARVPRFTDARAITETPVLAESMGTAILAG